ncbi:YbaB/EbfC family nucleoid-associated protein [Sphaerisporangium album]|uniref:YbaB/EbfC family nucleoid-associated protein n=1 Tax=Sphaerisporangium album TaxID=509200 RepID=UPI000DEBF2DB|nr:YbaB/EbfC family nucleoid-associated protein [Sphaerisporangium album]
MSSPNPWADDLERLELIVRETEEVMRGLLDAQNAIGRVTAEGTAAGGLMSVASDGAGRLTRVEFDPRVMRLSPDELGAEALKAIRQAQDTAVLKAREIAERARELAERFPAALDERFVRQRIDQVAREIE